MSGKRMHLHRVMALLTLLFLGGELTVLLASEHSHAAAQPPVALRNQVGKDRHDAKPVVASHCEPDWGILPSPNVGPDHNQLLGVAAISITNVWAVGTYLGWPYRPIIQHWDGENWSMVPGPDLGGAGELRGIATASQVPNGNDIWAVGYYDSGNRRWRTLALHWNGTNWTQVPTPNTGTGSNYLFGVKVIAPNDVWAVGSYCCVRYEKQTLTMHWDGSAWRVISSPSIAPMSNSLYEIDGVSANDVWAVGAYGAYDNRQTLIEHWDGMAWSMVGSPRQGTLLAITVLSATEAWAVGYTGSSFRQTLIMRLKGSVWEVAPSPSPGNDDNALYDVAAVSDNDIWAVGTYRNYYYPDETLIAHWDGGQWTEVPSPNRAGSSNYLYAVTTLSASNIWAVGESAGYEWESFITWYTGRITFRDVQETDYYYEAVRYLYCNGAISGYEDNTFRPYNLTTRGQLAKIVVLAEHWAIYTPPIPTFRDVPISNPFYTYIETAYNRGIVSGHSCGTRCLEYQPNNNVTRGQLCKIIVLAESWPIYTPPNPTFRDVPVSNVFYAYIETAYSHNIISGYSCGTNCLEFHPGDNATRGQIAKIVYNAIVAP